VSERPAAARTAPLLLHITTTDISLELLLGPQLRAFAAAGFDVVTASAPGPYTARLEADGIRHYPLRHATRSMAPHRDVAALAELWRLFQRIEPDIVHTHNPKPGLYGRMAARAARVPVIVNTVHGLYALPDDSRAKRTLVYGLERLAAACSHAELIQNPEDLEVLAGLGVPRSKLHLLGNGVDLRRFDPAALAPGRRDEVRAELGLQPGDVVCGAVGRLVVEKGYRDLFAAAATLASTASQVKVVVVGPEEPDKADAITQEELHQARASGIRLLGARDDMEDLYAAMDIYVLASHREGFPRSAMEAAAMGLPVIATDIRGCRQVVESGRTGTLVPPRRADALASAIGALAADADRRRAMGQAGRAKALREFDDRRVIDITLGVYDALGARPAAAPR
jgi:glycosyltransferase involved in cell wall biosynthesis